MSTNTASFSNHLKAWRRELGLTQAQLGQRVGCSAITIRKLESGERLPSVQLATLLAQHLRLSSEARSIFVNLARTPNAQHTHPALARVASSTTLIGRESDITEIKGVLTDGRTRLTTLTGPAGVGKTALAKAVAVQAANHFRHGMVWVDLTLLNSHAQVLPAIARTLGMTLSTDVDVEERLIDYLANKAMLLVLDNLEHVVGAAAQIVAIIEACPRLAVLTTSRIALRKRIETCVTVAPLSIDSSERLFAERASMARPHVKFNASDRKAIRELCGHLDGLPLAIELAATRVAIMSPQRALGLFVTEKKVVLPLIANHTADLPSRHRTLQGAIQSSIELLNPEQQQVFRYLSIFTGGFSLDAATQVACLASSSDQNQALAPKTQLATWATLTALLEANLLSSREITSGGHRDAEPEFYMLETIHAAARAALENAGERTTALERHAQYFEVLVRNDADTYERLHDTGAMHHLVRHMPEVLAAIHYAIEQGQAERACGMCQACGTAWKEYANYADGLVATEAALRLNSYPTPTYHRARAGALITLVRLNAESADHKRNDEIVTEALGLFRDSEDERGVWQALHQQAWLELWKDVKSAWQRHHALFETVTLANDTHWTAIKLTDMAVLCNLQHNPEQAVRYTTEAIRFFSALNDDANLSYALNVKATALLSLGQSLEARKTWQLALHHAADGSPSRTASLECALGWLAIWPDDPNEAIQHCTKAVELALKAGSPRIVYMSLIRQGLAEIAIGALGEAGQHLSQANTYLVKNNLATDAFVMRYYIGSAYVAARSNLVHDAIGLLKDADELAKVTQNTLDAFDLQLIEETHRICKSGHIIQ